MSVQMERIPTGPAGARRQAGNAPGLRKQHSAWNMQWSRAPIYRDTALAAVEPAHEEPQWYACYTRARHEKRVETGLRQRGFGSYLPTYQRFRQWKDRRKVISWPLFPGYIFSLFSVRDASRVLSIPGVVTIVRMNGRPAPVAAEEIENVRRFADALGEAGLEPEMTRFVAVGQWVRVREGPFAGVKGIVVERRNRRRVLVGVEAIGQGLEFDIEARVLEPIAGP
jgi:transcription antitermination factor NusG